MFSAEEETVHENDDYGRLEEEVVIEPEENSDPFSDGGFTSDEEETSSSDTDIDSYVTEHLRQNPAAVNTLSASVEDAARRRPEDHEQGKNFIPTRRSFRRCCACLLLLLLLSLLQCCGLWALAQPDSVVLSAAAAALFLPLGLFLARQPREIGPLGEASSDGGFLARFQTWPLLLAVWLNINLLMAAGFHSWPEFITCCFLGVACYCWHTSERRRGGVRLRRGALLARRALAEAMRANDRRQAGTQPPKDP